MDRSYLSDAGVIAAARYFVCIRLSTYESASENQVLRRLFVGGSGEVENTTFAILSPDGNTHLVRPGRGPNWAFQNPAHMAGVMRDIARHYHSDTTARGWALPTVATVRLALNVAACENLPLVITSEPSQLSRLAWTPELRGRAIYVQATTTPWGDARQSYLVVQPDAYGQSGQLLGKLPSTATAAELERTLQAYRPYSKDMHQHMREGQRRGVHWETAIPETDPHALPRR